MNLKSILTITLLSVTALALSVLLYARWLYPNADYIQIVITVLNLSPDVIKETIIPSDYAWGLLFFILVNGFFYNNSLKLFFSKLLTTSILSIASFINAS